jgi:NAD(P)-dependent dehydrogenase (short-subunit alcohol dehydrogenase family)
MAAKSRTVLVTGAASFVGSRLVDAYMKPRHIVAAAHCPNCGARIVHAKAVQAVAKGCRSESASDGSTAQDQRCVYILFGKWKTITERVGD